MKKIKLLLLVSIIISYASIAQVTRQTQPVNKTITTPTLQSAKKDTVPARITTGPVTKATNPPLTKIIPPSLLTGEAIIPNLKYYYYYQASDPDVKPAVWLYQYYAGELKYTIGKTETPQWKADFVWHHVPSNASSARVEISSLPFSSENVTDAGIVETKIIQRTSPDSIKFNIYYKEKTTSAGPVIRTNNKTPLLIKKTTNRQLKTTNLSLEGLKNYGNYYVRLTALDGRGQPIGKGGNVIKIVPDYISFPPLPVPTSEDSLQSDYEITAINYIQPHYPEGAYANCIIVTGYNEGKNIDPFGNTWETQIINSFKQAWPIGTVICPSPPKEKSWYEKAFNSVTGAAEIAINGASKVYSETKGYLKSKFSEYMCNYDPVVSTNKKLIEQTGVDKKTIDDGCAAATGVAFEIAMSYAGMPPSIPNFDEMCRLAKGQVVQLLIQKAAERTGMPCDETCAELIAKGLDQMIEESAKKNIQNGGFFNYKPDPRGQYRLPYVEIEITRKRNTQKGERLLTNLNFTPGMQKTFSLNDITGKAYTTTINSYDLYEKIQLPVPYLKQTGDKIKLIAVLTPKFAFVVTSCSDKKITGIAPKQQLCLGWNTIEQPGEDAKNSSGYNMMVENSTISISPAGKIKLANGVTTTFVHHK